MRRCPACGEYLEGDRDRIGARCPYCRLPLYERPERFKPRPPDTENFCTAHPQNPAVGACQRCGNFQCDLCRSRWRDRSLCVACVNRMLEANEMAPEEARAHLVQSVLALVLGIAEDALPDSLLPGAIGVQDIADLPLLIGGQVQRSRGLVICERQRATPLPPAVQRV